MRPTAVFSIRIEDYTRIGNKMNSARLYIVSLLFAILPESRLFPLKASLLRWAGACIGRNVRVCSSVRIYGNAHLSIGDDTWLGHHTLIIASGDIHIGSNVDIGPRVYLGTGTHKIDPIGQHSAGTGVRQPVVIGNGVWLCSSVVILPGVSIGEKTIIGAGSVVLKQVPQREIHAGVPARFIRKL